MAGHQDDRERWQEQQGVRAGQPFSGYQQGQAMVMAGLAVAAMAACVVQAWVAQGWVAQGWAGRRGARWKKTIRINIAIGASNNCRALIRITKAGAMSGAGNLPASSTNGGRNGKVSKAESRARWGRNPSVPQAIPVSWTWNANKPNQPRFGGAFSCRPHLRFGARVWNSTGAWGLLSPWT